MHPQRAQSTTLATCPNILLVIRPILFAFLALCLARPIHAQETLPLAQELVTTKTGYTDKKRDLEELRVRAYVPVLLKAVGKGPAWNPQHPNWAATEKRINAEWRKLYADYLARMARDAGFAWIDEALAREYSQRFTVEELTALLAFYRSPAGAALIELEKLFLVFYPAELTRALSRVMIGNDALSAAEQVAFRAPENRLRREFAVLFESETILFEEALRIGGAFVGENAAFVQQGAVATAAAEIDALRQKLPPALLAEVQAFLKTDAGLKEREFLALALRIAAPAGEDTARAKQEEAAFYKGLAELSAQWRAAAAGEKAPE
jgi:hypothetical protein